MDLQLAAVADFAAVDAVGKLNIIGACRNLNPPQLPFATPLIFVVFQYSCNKAETGRDIRVEVLLQEQDGKTVITTGEMLLKLGVVDTPDGRSDLPLIFRIDALQIDKARSVSMGFANERDRKGHNFNVGEGSTDCMIKRSV